MEELRPEEVYREEVLEHYATVPDFNEFEEEYQEYLSEEVQPSSYAPAICVKDLFARPELPVLSYAEGFIYAGAINLVGGEPKAGKSTLVWHICNSVANGRPFLGHDTRKSNIVYVTEQNEVSFRHETKTIPGFSVNDNIYALLPENWTEPTWLERIKFWENLLSATNSGVLVIDTFGAFAALPFQGENDSAIVSERFMQLKVLFKKRPNLAIVLVHHVRKPSNDPKLRRDTLSLSDMRGSNALVGAADHVVMLGKDTRQKTRQIHLEGRFVDEQDFQIVLTDHGYVESRISNLGMRI